MHCCLPICVIAYDTKYHEIRLFVSKRSRDTLKLYADMPAQRRMKSYTPQKTRKCTWWLLKMAKMRFSKQFSQFLFFIYNLDGKRLLSVSMLMFTLKDILGNSVERHPVSFTSCARSAHSSTMRLSVSQVEALNERIYAVV